MKKNGWMDGWMDGCELFLFRELLLLVGICVIWNISYEHCSNQIGQVENST